jgi:death-on-curing protein
MEFVNKGLSEEYQRWTDTLTEEKALFDDCRVGVTDILNIHFCVVDFFIDSDNSGTSPGNIGPIDKELLSSAVSRQIDGYPGYPEWETDYEKCATLFYGLVKNHPFHDYNKRTALLTALYYLAKLGREPSACHKELEIITLIIASNEIRNRKAFKPYSKFEDGEIRFLAQYFQKNTRTIEKKYYAMTYHELNKLLIGYGFALNNPQAGSIEVTRIEKRPTMFGLRRKGNRHTRVGVVRFAGWTREVAEDGIDHLREVTGLTAADGLDSQLAYAGDPPLSSLINEYRDTLQRIAKK